MSTFDRNWVAQELTVRTEWDWSCLESLNPLAFVMDYHS